MKKLVKRAVGKWRRTLASNFARRELVIVSPRPLISFTFDDAPCSAFDTGADILLTHGARATFFMSMGLLNQETEVGLIAGADRLAQAVHNGHELGCHTFGHLDAWHTADAEFVASVDANQRALTALLPGQAFRVFAYPKSGAKLSVKAALQARFACCRGGGQDLNAGVVDLNLLNACFLDQRANIDIHFIRDLIDRNAQARGWLIFAAHDISKHGSRFGCATDLFADVVRAAAASGAQLLPMGEACAQLQRT
jgi:hypothetical protein